MSLWAPLSHTEGQESRAGEFSRHTTLQLSSRSLNYEDSVACMHARMHVCEVVEKAG